MPLTNEEYREKYATDAEFREETKKRVLFKYHNDPEYHANVLRRAKERYLRIKAEKKANEPKQ
jgi:hypothetical protein